MLKSHKCIEWIQRDTNRLPKTIYNDLDIFGYLEDFYKLTPIWVDTPRVDFYKSVMHVISCVDYKNITLEDVFFYSQLNDEDICPHDNEKLQEYCDDNLLNIKKNIILNIITWIKFISMEFDPSDKPNGDVGLSIPLIKETRDRLVDVARNKMTLTKNDLYLKLLSLRNSLKLANKRYKHLEIPAIKECDISPYGCVLNISEVSEGLLKWVPILEKESYNFNNEDDLNKLFYFCDKNNMRITVLVLECLLLLVDTLKSTDNNKLMHKLFPDDNRIMDSLAKSNANSWISSIPSFEPNNVIQVTKVKKFRNIKNVVNRGDIFDKKIPVYKYLYSIYSALANDNCTWR